MNLIIDVGNTQIKLAIFQKGRLLEKRIIPKSAFFKSVISILEDFPKIDLGIVASVGGVDTSDLQKLKERLPIHQLNEHSQVPFINTYDTPETLGVDRIALVAAATVKFPIQDVLIIDAGSCITYDLLTQENRYIGGAISPGISQRYKALHEFTAGLPMLEKQLPDSLMGNTTSSSMHIGVIEGAAREIDGFIEAYRERYPEIKIIFTGGDAELLRDRLKNDTFANSNFLLEGLQTILELNKDRC